MRTTVTIFYHITNIHTTVTLFYYFSKIHISVSTFLYTAYVCLDTTVSLFLNTIRFQIDFNAMPLIYIIKYLTNELKINYRTMYRGKRPFKARGQCNNHPYQAGYRNNFKNPQNAHRNQNYNVHNSDNMPNPEPNYRHTNNDEVKRLKEISMLSYLEKRGLKAILTGNPRFHLVAFNGVPKYIKTSVFLTDLIRSIPDLRPKAVISIHCSQNKNDNETIDYLIGFNTIKIMKKLEEVCGNGYLNLYKKMVQFVMPDLESYNCCEYNVNVEEELTITKQPFKMTHTETNITEIITILENVCGEKFFHVSAICCTGETTYINVNHSALFFLLNKAADEFNYYIESSDTIAMTGIIPSALMPAEIEDTPVNSSSTAKLSTEEIVKFNGFKSIYDNYAKELKNQEINLIKRSLRESEATLHNAFNDLENKIEEKLIPIETKINTCLTRLEEVSQKLDRNQLFMIEMEKRLLYAVNNKETKIIAKPNTTTATTTVKATRGNKRQPPVNPSTNGTTGMGEGEWKHLEEEIDNTPED